MGYHGNKPSYHVTFTDNLPQLIFDIYSHLQL